MTIQNISKRTDRYTMRLRLLSNVFNKIDRIMLMDSKVKVTFLENKQIPYPGWSSYPNIFINTAHFQNLGDARTVVQLLGLNYHEMGHLMFTPRNVFSWLPAEHKKAWNVLEDQRMESFFTAQYKPAGKYFTEMVVRFMVDDERTWSSAFMWTYGRSYIPLEIREEFEARFALTDEVDRIKELIDQYKTFKAYHFRSKQRVVKSVVEEFHNIMLRLEAHVPSLPQSACEDGNQPNNDESLTPGKNDIDEEREKDAANKERKQREKEEQTGEDQSGFWEDDDEEEPEADGEDDGDSEESDGGDDDGEGTDGDEDSEDSGGSGSDDGGDSEEEEGEGDDSDDDGDGSDGSDLGDDDDDYEGSGGTESGDGDSDSDGSEDDDLDDGGEGAGDGPSSAFDDDELKQYLDEIEDAVNDDEAVENEVRQILQTVNDPSNTDVIDFPPEVDALTKEPVTAGMSASVKTMQLELRKLHAEIDPGWHYGSDVGRLNIDRAMREPENYDELYDEWFEGREHETGLEVVILLDISYSMMHAGYGGNRDVLIEPASKALWCIKAALDDVDAKVTVLGFDSNLIGLSSREEKFSRTAYTEFRIGGGGTAPAQAFHVSRRLFAQSQLPNKLLVIITDGDWQHNDPSDPSGIADLPDLIDQIDAVKMYIGIGNDAGGNKDSQQRCHVTKQFSNPLDLVPAVQRVVMSLLASRR